MRRALPVAVLLATLVPAVASAQESSVPGHPPAACAAASFTDQVLTNEDDAATAGFGATRLYGLYGDDRLTGSPTRATCLFGGRGDDVVTLGAGGGIAYGEAGADTLTGSALADVLVGGAGVDAFRALGGDDRVDSRDGTAELVDCGDGDDTVTGDRQDALVRCETARLSGPAPTRLAVRPARVGYRGATVLRLRAPHGGGAAAYRVLLLTPRAPGARRGCAGGPVTLARFPAGGARVRRGGRVALRLRAPRGGWCRGPQQAAVLYAPSATRPVEPLARVVFRAGPGRSGGR